jgi:hypothetical protein
VMSSGDNEVRLKRPCEKDDKKKFIHPTNIIVSRTDCGESSQKRYDSSESGGQASARGMAYLSSDVSIVFGRSEHVSLRFGRRDYGCDLHQYRA